MSKQSMKITKRLLQSKGACTEQVNLFAELFPKGVVLTKRVCMKFAHKFDFGWAAKNLLNETQMAEYEKVEGPAWAEYEKVEGPALAEYLKVKGPAWAEYEKQIAVAFYLASKTK